MKRWPLLLALLLIGGSVAAGLHWRNARDPGITLTRNGLLAAGLSPKLTIDNDLYFVASRSPVIVGRDAQPPFSIGPWWSFLPGRPESGQPPTIVIDGIMYREVRPPLVLRFSVPVKPLSESKVTVRAYLCSIDEAKQRLEFRDKYPLLRWLRPMPPYREIALPD
jgi:hypothetical protein